MKKKNLKEPKEIEETLIKYKELNFLFKFKFDLKFKKGDFEIDPENEDKIIIDYSNFFLIFEFVNNLEEENIKTKYSIGPISNFIDSEEELDDYKITKFKLKHNFENYLINEKFCNLLSKNPFYVSIIDNETKNVYFQEKFNYSSILVKNIDNIINKKIEEHKNKEEEEGKKDKKDKKDKNEKKFYADLYKNQINDYNDNLKNFIIYLKSDGTLLSNLLYYRLNPFIIEIKKIRNILLDEIDNKFNHIKNYENIYFNFKFLDSEISISNKILRLKDNLIDIKHIILLGEYNQIDVSEYFKMNKFQIEIHSRDYIDKPNIIKRKEITKFEFIKNEENIEIVKDNKNSKKEKEKPKKVVKNVQKKTKNQDLDLKEFKFLENENLINNFFFVCSFKLDQFNNKYTNFLKFSNSLKPFYKRPFIDKKNLDLNKWAKIEKSKKLNTLETLLADSIIIVTFSLKYPINSYDEKLVEESKILETEDEIEKNWKNKIFYNEIDNKIKTNFQRIIILIKYKNEKMMNLVKNTFNLLNKQYLKMEELADERELRIRVIPEEEKNGNFDYLTGCEIIDNEYRIFFIEGIKDGNCLNKLKEFIPKLKPNDDELKILRNENLNYKERIYKKFNYELKKIKIRTNISKLIYNPTIYNETKTSKNIYKTITFLFNLKHKNELKEIEENNFFLKDEDFIELEIFYGDSLTNEDITGIPKVTKTRRKLHKHKKGIKKIETSYATQKTLVLSLNELRDTDKKNDIKIYETEKIMTIENKISNLDNDVNEIIETNTEDILKNSDLKNKFENTKLYEKYNMHLEKVLDDKKDIYINSNLKHNYYIKELEKLKEQVKNDKNYFYTWSKEYLSLSIDPYDVKEIKKKLEEENKKKILTKEGFQTIIKKSKKEQLKNKLDETKIYDLNNYPYHEHQTNIKNILNNKHGLKKDFQKFLPKIELFNKIKDDRNYDFPEKPKIKCSPENKNNIKIRKKGAGKYNIDKYKGLLDMPPVKKGLYLPESYLNYGSVFKKKYVNQKPDFFNLLENNQSEYNLKNESKEIKRDFNKYMPNILTKNYVHKPNIK